MFPERSADQVLRATRGRWDIDGVVPVPKDGWLSCPVCGASGPQPRWWKWHKRPRKATIPWRCDVSLKCIDCAAVWLHGVALDEASWDRRPMPYRDRRDIPWREIRDLL